MSRQAGITGFTPRSNNLKAIPERPEEEALKSDNGGGETRQYRHLYGLERKELEVAEQSFESEVGGLDGRHKLEKTGG